MEGKWRSGGEVEKWRTTCKCVLIGGRSPRHLNTFSYLLPVAVRYTNQYMLCTVAIVCCTLHTPIHAMYCCCTLHTPIHAMHCCYCWLYTTHTNTCYALLLLLAVHYTHQYTLSNIAIIDCIHVWSATASFEDL